MKKTVAIVRELPIGMDYVDLGNTILITMAYVKRCVKEYLGVEYKAASDSRGA